MGFDPFGNYTPDPIDILIQSGNWAPPAPDATTSAPPPADAGTVAGPEPPPYNPSPTAPSLSNTGVSAYSAPLGGTGTYWSPSSSPLVSPTSPTQATSPYAPPGVVGPGPARPAATPRIGSIPSTASGIALPPLIGSPSGVTASASVPPPNPNANVPPYRQVESQWSGWLGRGGGGVTAGPPGLFRAPQDQNFSQLTNRFNTERASGIGGQYARALGGPQTNFMDFGEGRGPVNVRTGQGYLWYDPGRPYNAIPNAGAGRYPPGGFAGQGATGGTNLTGPPSGGGAYQPSSTAGAAGLTQEAVADQYRKSVLAALGQGDVGY